MTSNTTGSSSSLGQPPEALAGVVRPIRRLEEAVVNRIAAGEVIQRPANAIKELLENCLDAGATQIQITVKQGGLRLIQIQDNGCGIRREDMPIVCERFTTSKLQSFSDLQSLGTFGFRGEALASISHVAHLSITSRTSDSQCAYRAEYSDGAVKGDVRPCAGNQGTCIQAEQLFYNVPLRRQALKSPREEFAKIADVVTRYAVHNCARSGFTLRRLDEASSGTGTGSGPGGCPPAPDVRSVAGTEQRDTIGALFGAEVARELLTLLHTDIQLGLKTSGLVTNANYSTRKLTLLLFINERLVDCTSLRRAVENVYAALLPKKSAPFLYLSLHLPPQNVDVNVHPTKHEVHFLHEDAVVASLQSALERVLLGCNESRNFLTRALLPPSVSTVAPVMDRVRVHETVRTDAKERKIDAFYLDRRSVTAAPEGTLTSSSSQVDAWRTPAAQQQEQVTASSTDTMAMTVPAKQQQEEHSTSSPRPQTLATPQREIRLSSVLAMQTAVRDGCCASLRTCLRDCTFIGCVDRELCLVQHQLTLLLVNLTALTEELFYQLIVFNFANLGQVVLSEPPPIGELVKLAMETEETGWRPVVDGNKEEVAQMAARVLCARADMLWDYFSLRIDGAGRLVAIPLLLDRYLPDLTGLPLYVLRLATEVDWEEERACFEDVCRETARFYSVRRGSSKVTEAEVDSSCSWTTEHVLLPAIRAALLPTAKFQEDGSLLSLSSLPDLYKVFERC